MFGSKPSRQLKEARNLVKKEKWNEAIAMLSALQYEPKLDSGEVLSLLNQARRGLAQQQTAIAKQLIKRKRFSDALSILHPINSEYPDDPDVTRLIGQAQDGIARKGSHFGEQRSQLNKIWVVLALVFVLAIVDAATPDSSSQESENNSITPTSAQEIVQSNPNANTPVSITATEIRTITQTPNPQTGVLTVTAGDYRLSISRIWEAPEASREKPDSDNFLILDITLYNDSSKEYCFHDRDFKAAVGDNTLNPDNLREVRDEFFAGRDYPGGFTGQCVKGQSHELSLLEYDVPADISNITMRFTPNGETAEFSLWLDRGLNEEMAFGLQSLEKGVALVNTPTITPIPTLTFTPSETPPITDTPTQVTAETEPFASAMVSEDAVRQELEGVIDFGYKITLDKILDIKVEDNVDPIIDGDKTVRVYYTFTAWDENDIVYTAAATSLEIFRRLFANPAITKVAACAQQELIDVYGNTEIETAVEFVMYRETADRLSWEGVKDNILLDYTKLFPLTEFSIHPAIRKHLDITIPTSVARIPTQASETIRPESSSTPSPTRSGEIWVISSAQRVNIRSCASTDCSVITSLESGTQITVLSTQNDWHRIRLSDGREGYVATFLTSRSSSGDTATEPLLTTAEASVTFDEELLFLIIQYAMLEGGFTVNSLDLQGDTLVVDAQLSLEHGYNDSNDYFFSYIGGLTGAITTSYEMEGVTATRPRRITIKFTTGGITITQVSYLYRDAIAYAEGDMTSLSFMGTWTVE